MIADAIRDVAGCGDIVLDIFGGSGSTLIAADKTGRRSFICELGSIATGSSRVGKAYAHDEVKQLVCGWAGGHDQLRAAE